MGGTKRMRQAPYSQVVLCCTDYKFTALSTRPRLSNQFSAPLVTTAIKAVLRWAYEPRGKRERKCHLKFSEESSLKILLHTNPSAPNSLFIFSSYFSSIVNRPSCAACYSIFSLYVSVFFISVLC